MSGAMITWALAGDAAKRLAAIEGGPARALKPIGQALLASTHERFRDEAGPDGAKWAPLHPAYAAFKRGPGILRGSALSGGLMDSITDEVSEAAGSVEVGTNKPYGAIHQFGGVIKPKRGKALAFRLGGRLVLGKKVTIPARPYLGISAEDGLEIEAIIARVLARALR
jgi:phage virion morphogenesis protein